MDFRCNGSNREEPGASPCFPLCPRTRSLFDAIVSGTSGEVTIAAWQRNDELGEFAEPGFDVDPPAMLLDNDVMGHREAESRPFAGWLRGEKGIEHLFSHFGSDTDAVVANSDFDCLAEVSGDCGEHGFKRPSPASTLRRVAA